MSDTTPTTDTQADAMKDLAKDLFSHPDKATPQAPTPTVTPEAASQPDPAAVFSAAIRSRVGSDYGISSEKGPNGEPSDAELLLNGTDEATIIAQAKRLTEIDRRDKPGGNTARREGHTPEPNQRTEAHELAGQLFGSDH